MYWEKKQLNWLFPAKNSLTVPLCFVNYIDFVLEYLSCLKTQFPSKVISINCLCLRTCQIVFPKSNKDCSTITDRRGTWHLLKATENLLGECCLWVAGSKLWITPLSPMNDLGLRKVKSWTSSSETVGERNFPEQINVSTKKASCTLGTGKEWEKL